MRARDCAFSTSRSCPPTAASVLAAEESAGLRELATYRGFQARADALKDELIAFLIEQKRLGRRVAGYGAAAKGNTLLNYGGVKPDLLSFICDGAPSKQGKLTPGGHIPILRPDAMQERRPDVVLILPWNIADEIIAQLPQVREWGGQFAVAVPRLRLLQALP